MKKNLFVIGLLALLSTACAEKTADSKSVKPEGVQAEPAKEENVWSTDFAASLGKAKAENKFMLVDFSGSDWCGWCMKLDKEVFSQKEFQEFAKANLVLVLLDFPRRKPQSETVKAQNEKLMNHYAVQGFPTVLIFNPVGTLVETTGYQPGGAEAYVAYLKGVLERERVKNVKN